ncbi:MAG: hypothetical protein ABSG19_12380 [Candidatus Aminicenantales bacterium]
MKAKPRAKTPRQLVARQFRKLTGPLNEEAVEFLEANGITKASLEAGIASDRKMLETIEPIFQKAAPASFPILRSMSGLKRAYLKGIKVREKILSLIDKASK